MSTTTHWRHQLLWFPMGGLLGALAGAANGAVMMLVAVALDGDLTLSREGTVGGVVGGLVAATMIGLFFGGIAGLVVGLFVGVGLMFLVGAHLPRDVARQRAYSWGFVLPPVTLLVAVVALGGGDISLAGSDAVWAMPLAGASLLGGPLARWLAGFQPPRPPVS